MKQMKTFDYNKPFQLRDGRKAKLVNKLVNGSNPLIVVVTQENGNEYVSCYPTSGLSSNNNGSNDLINTPENKRITAYLHVYNDGSFNGYPYPSDGDPELFAVKKLEIDVEEGEGLS